MLINLPDYCTDTHALFGLSEVSERGDCRVCKNAEGWFCFRVDSFALLNKSGEWVASNPEALNVCFESKESVLAAMEKNRPNNCQRTTMDWATYRNCQFIAYRKLVKK